MKHLIVCREYPPAPHPPGGIGTYTIHIARLLAEAGETVHVIAQGWHGATAGVSESVSGRLVVHRVALDEPVAGHDSPKERRMLTDLLQSDCPSQTFSWQTARIAERLVQEEGIDLLEAPEWEAPLYYLQLRRALGLGPCRQPPCLIHLHAPAEFIIRSNEWDETLADLIPLRRFEEFTIRAADALLCPSRYLARGAAHRFGVSEDEITVVPYPLGDSTPIERAPQAWTRNLICYIGRLELRKGVVEWVDAAVEVARTDPRVEFDFIGSDTSLDGSPDTSVRAKLDERIPDDLRPRFHFQPSRPRADLRRLLAGISIAVIPSRWDNLPYTCIEAMCSGLPVLVSPNGGMAELVRDGDSGWVSADGTPKSLADALRRALDTPAERRAAMGRNAELAARRICGNEAVLARHLELRSRVAGIQPTRSRRIPACAGEASHAAAPSAIGVVVTPAGAVEARTEAAKALLSDSPQLLGITFVTADVRLDPAYLQQVESVLRSEPHVGIVSTFLQHGEPWNELDATPVPVCYSTAPLADPSPCLTVRSEALFSTGTWAAVTYPDVLAYSAAGPTQTHKRYSAMALSQGGSPKMALQWFQSATTAEKLRSVLRIFKQPRRMAQWAGWLVRAAVNKAR